jgi:hypothetical protein
MPDSRAAASAQGSQWRAVPHAGAREQQPGVVARSASSPATVDNALMARVCTGNTVAFGELYDLHSVRAYRLARAVCFHRDDAEQAVQEAFVSIYNSRTSFQSQRGTLSAWVLSVVRHRALDVSRNNVRDTTRRADLVMLLATSLKGARRAACGSCSTRFPTLSGRSSPWRSMANSPTTRSRLTSAYPSERSRAACASG